MVKAKRFTIVLNGVKYNLSPEQVGMISTSKFRLPLPMSWNVEQRVRGLVTKKLAKWGSKTTKSVTIERTHLGKDVFSTFSRKLKSSEKELV